MKHRCLKSAVNANKSEVIRAGLHIIQSLSDEELVQAQNRQTIRKGIKTINNFYTLPPFSLVPGAKLQTFTENYFPLFIR